RRHTRLQGDWSSDVCSSDLNNPRISPTVLADERSVWGADWWIRVDRNPEATLDPRAEPTNPPSNSPTSVQRPIRNWARASSRSRSEERRVGKEGRSRSATEP